MSILNFKESLNKKGDFSLCFWERPGHYMGIILNNHYQHIINLDEEDMDYLKSKYLKRLKDELDDELKKVKEKYERI